MIQLSPGQRTPLSAIGVDNLVHIDVDYTGIEIDVVVFGLDAAGRIGDDRYTVLHNNPASPGRAIVMTASAETTAVDIDLDAVPTSIDRIMIVASHDELALCAAKPFAFSVGEATFDVGAFLGAERAAMIAEIYRRNGEWRLTAIGQGFSAGLAKLIEHLGGMVEDADSGGSTQQSIVPPPEAPSAPISLKKITLERSEGISLEKTTAGYGDIVLNLNWALDLDLDLGCLFELADGSKGVIQALGKSFGTFDRPPFIALDGDDRTGSNTTGETIRINGRHFAQFRRIAVFALIYEGAVRWNETDARMTLTMPGQPEIMVALHDGSDQHRVYGMAIIDNEDGRGSMRVVNHGRCYRNQKAYADDIGIHLRWAVGAKD